MSLRFIYQILARGFALLKFGFSPILRDPFSGLSFEMQGIKYLHVIDIICTGSGQPRDQMSAVHCPENVCLRPTGQQYFVEILTDYYCKKKNLLKKVLVQLLWDEEVTNIQILSDRLYHYRFFGCVIFYIMFYTYKISIILRDVAIFPMSQNSWRIVLISEIRARMVCTIYEH